MTDQQHPGGVAGRVLQELQRYEETTPYSEPDQQRELGAKQMHTELSQEARAMIAEFSDNASVEDKIYLQGLEALSRRLGLDLESEDGE